MQPWLKYWPEKKLRICVTGAGGFIASHLAKRLKEEGHTVVGCDWKRNEHMPVSDDPSPCTPPSSFDRIPYTSYWNGARPCASPARGL